MVFWYNIESGEVEADEVKSKGENLMGPYDTEAEARDALSTAAEKTEKWDEEDKAWEEKGWGSAADEGSC